MRALTPCEKGMGTERVRRQAGVAPEALLAAGRRSAAVSVVGDDRSGTVGEANGAPHDAEALVVLDPAQFVFGKLGFDRVGLLEGAVIAESDVTKRLVDQPDDLVTLLCQCHRVSFVVKPSTRRSSA
jgi:hypothetical protein